MSEYKKALDVSHYQRGLAIPDSISHCIIKMGQHDFQDSECENFISQCEKKKIPVDLYWYLQASRYNDVEVEINNLKSIFKNLSLKFPKTITKETHIWIDVEETGQNNRGFLIRLCAAATGAKLNFGLYMCWAWYKELMMNNSAFKNIPIWLAWWGADSESVSGVPNIVFHQYGTTNIDDYSVDINNIMVSETSNNALVHLSNTALYSSANNDYIVTRLTGDYYYYDDEVINNRRRITSDVFRRGAEPVAENVTGWIDYNAENAPVEENTNEIKPLSFVTETVPLYSSAYEAVSCGCTHKGAQYYAYDNNVINGRIRITVDKEHIGDSNYAKYVTGFIDRNKVKI